MTHLDQVAESPGQEAVILITTAVENSFPGGVSGSITSMGTIIVAGLQPLHTRTQLSCFLFVNFLCSSPYLGQNLTH